MKKILLSLFLLATIIPANAKIVTKTITVYFASNSATLKLNQTQVLNQLIDLATTYTDYEIFIEGHTDSDGSNSYNKKLSENRTQFVKEYLNQKGINKDLIFIKYFGETNPKSSNKIELGKQENRRVEVTLKQYLWDDVSEVNAVLAQKNSITTIINPKESNLLISPNSIKIYLEANSFVLENGALAKDKLEIKLTEAVKLSQFVNENSYRCIDEERFFLF